MKKLGICSVQKALPDDTARCLFHLHQSQRTTKDCIVSRRHRTGHHLQSCRYWSSASESTVWLGGLFDEPCNNICKGSVDRQRIDESIQGKGYRKRCARKCRAIPTICYPLTAACLRPYRNCATATNTPKPKLIASENSVSHLRSI